MRYITIKFTKRQVEIFLKHFNGCAEEWLEEKPKGRELQEAQVIERFFKKLKASVIEP